MDVMDVVQTVDEMKGTFDILFTGEDSPRRLVIDGRVTDTWARILYLYTPDGTIYNFSNVISIRKVR